MKRRTVRQAAPKKAVPLTTEDLKKKTAGKGKSLLAQNRELKKKLMEQTMLAESYGVMIDMADQDLQTNIRKKYWYKTVETMRAKDPDTNKLSRLCRLFCRTTQAFYKRDVDVIERKQATEQQVLDYIKKLSAKDSKMAGKKMWQLYQKEVKPENAVGRDRFMKILANHRAKRTARK